MRRIRFFLYFLPIIVFLIAEVTIELNSSRALGSKNNPVKIFFTPSVDAQSISTGADELISFLEKETGYHYATAVPTSFIAVVEAFGSSRADIALINTFSYLMANKKFGAHAKLRIVRDNNLTTYRGMIVVRSSDNISSVKQLNGKKIAYVDASSTSGYILPKTLLDRNNVKPSETVFAMKHDNVVTMVYQGQVDAGACFYLPPDIKTGKILDARYRVATQFPDVEQKVKILALTDEIPNDPIVFRDGIPEEMQEQIINALFKFMQTEQGKQTMLTISDIRGLIRTQDSDFDGLRTMLNSLDMNLEDMLKK